MSGSGKSELLKSFVKDDIIKNEDGIIIIDPNGDFAEQIARFKQNYNPERLHKTIYIDPTLSDYLIPVINPFELPDDLDYFIYGNYQNIIEPRADEITLALEQIFNDMDSGFTPKMKTYLFPAVCAVLLKKDGGFDDLLRFFGSDDNLDLIELGKKSPNKIQSEYFKNWEIPNTTREAITDKIRLLLQYSKFRDIVTGKSTINLPKAILENKLIIFNLSKGLLGERVSKYYGKLMISIIQSTVMARAKMSLSTRTKTIMYIDEFHNYINNSIKEMLQDARKYGFFMYLASQQTGQDMDSGIKASVYGNTKLKIIGTQQDPQSIKTVSGFLDMKLEEVKSIPFHDFYVKIGTKIAFKMKTSTENLNNKNSMTNEEWFEFQDHMKSIYYRKRTEEKKTNNPPKDSNGNEFRFNPKYED